MPSRPNRSWVPSFPNQAQSQLLVYQNKSYCTSTEQDLCRVSSFSDLAACSIHYCGQSTFFSGEENTACVDLSKSDTDPYPLLLDLDAEGSRLQLQPQEHAYVVRAASESQWSKEPSTPCLLSQGRTPPFVRLEASPTGKSICSIHCII